MLVYFSPAPSTPPAKEEEWSDIPSDVVHLKDDTFDDFIANNPSVLVMFYAPCKYHFFLFLLAWPCRELESQNLLLVFLVFLAITL